MMNNIAERLENEAEKREVEAREAKASIEQRKMDLLSTRSMDPLKELDQVGPKIVEIE